MNPFELTQPEQINFQYHLKDFVTENELVLINLTEQWVPKIVPNLNDPDIVVEIVGEWLSHLKKLSTHLDRKGFVILNKPAYQGKCQELAKFLLKQMIDRYVDI